MILLFYTQNPLQDCLTALVRSNGIRINSGIMFCMIKMLLNKMLQNEAFIIQYKALEYSIQIVQSCHLIFLYSHW